MVRAGYGRILKYKAKIDPEPVRIRFTAMRDIMTEQMTAITGELRDIETSSKEILHAEGVETIAIPVYLAYVRLLYNRRRMFTGNTLNKEAQYIYDKFKARGLVSAILVDLAKIQGITILAP